MGICQSKGDSPQDDKKAEEASPSPQSAGSAPAGGPKRGRRNSYQAPEIGANKQDQPGRNTATSGVCPFPKEKLGTFSNHGVKPGPFGGSSAKINQDRGIISYPLAGDPSMALFCVFDGHGSYGELVSEYAMIAIVEFLEENYEALKQDPEKVLYQSTIVMDKKLKTKRNIPCFDSGTTAIIVLMIGDVIWTANVGDSRAVKATQQGGKLVTTDLSIDQKPDDPAERQRILANGGFVSEASEAFGPARVWIGMVGQGPGLAMARSVGDHAVKEVGVTAEPEIKQFPVSPDDKYLIVASDGVWEFITSEEAVKIVANKPNASVGCKALIKEAARKWRIEEGNYRDDITAIVVQLPILPDGAASQPTDSSYKKQPMSFDSEHKAKYEGEQPEADELEEETAAVPTTSAEPKNKETSFAKRRLSIAQEQPKDPDNLQKI